MRRKFILFCRSAHIVGVRTNSPYQKLLLGILAWPSTSKLVQPLTVRYKESKLIIHHWYRLQSTRKIMNHNNLTDILLNLFSLLTSCRTVFVDRPESYSAIHCKNCIFIAQKNLHTPHRRSKITIQTLKLWESLLSLKFLCFQLPSRW